MRPLFPVPIIDSRSQSNSLANFLMEGLANVGFPKLVEFDEI